MDWHKLLTVVEFERLNGLVPTMPPRCKCGRPCQRYGGIGGFSKRCVSCNEKNAARQRAARAAKKPGGE